MLDMDRGERELSNGIEIVKIGQFNNSIGTAQYSYHFVNYKNLINFYLLVEAEENKMTTII